MDGHIDESTRRVTRLWTLTQPKVSAFVTSVVRDFKDRDDLVQDIAVAVFESFDKYDPERPFVQWAMGVARNQFKNYLRQRHLAVLIRRRWRLWSMRLRTCRRRRCMNWTSCRNA